MMIIRPISKRDGEALEGLAMLASLGMTHLPKRRDCLEKKISSSLEAFAKQVFKPQQEEYVFVLEDLETGKILGTCAILSKMGVSSPSYLYRISSDFSAAPRHLPYPHEIRVLHADFHQNSHSEICALYLLPEFRKSGLGKLLSLSRFLFIAAYPQRFEQIIVAEMRGYIDEDNQSPFWDGVGRHFLDVSFEDVMKMRSADASFIPEILPRHPIYATFLAEKVCQMIGQVHPRTEPALKMLTKQGFQFINEIDFFDGGPDIAAKTSEIKAIKESILSEVYAISERCTEGKHCLISNERLDFRACCEILEETSHHTVIISKEVAQALNVKKGDFIRYVDC